MAIVRSAHTIQLEGGYELTVVREDRNPKILFSLDKRTDQGWVHERLTIAIPIGKAYKMAKFILGLAEVLDEQNLEGFED